MLIRIFHHPFPRHIRISFTRPGKKQTQEIIHLRRRPHCRTRIFIRRFLLDRNNRTQTGNLIRIRTFHTSQKLTGICRKSFHITALPFGINRIECQRRFSASAQTGNHRQTIPRNRQIHVFQIVFTGTVYLNNFILFHNQKSINLQIYNKSERSKTIIDFKL